MRTPPKSMNASPVSVATRNCPSRTGLASICARVPMQGLNAGISTSYAMVCHSTPA